MDALNTFLSLLARTEARDKFLRLIQFALLHSTQDKVKGSAFQVYKSMRMTRKLLRFLRSLEYSTKIREELPKLMNSLSFLPNFLKYLTSILQNLFTMLYFLSDHRVCLSELKVIDPSHHTTHFPRSMKFYFLQNLFGILRNLVEISNQMGKNSKNTNEIADKIKSLIFDLIRCFLDCFIAIFYWKNKYTANIIGKVGVVSSAMAIAQSLQII